MKELFYQYNPWWENDFDIKGIHNRPAIITQMEKSLSNKSIVIITGLRRIGKTTAIKLFIKKLLEKNINPKHIFYISLDDYSLRKLSISEIITEYRKIHKLSLETKIFLFLDEITYKPDPHIQLKNLYDNQNVKIYTSSSSASLLNDKKALLTGRETVIEINPLDFHEFLEFKNIKIKKSEQYLIDPFFEEFLQTGGIPEYVLSNDREYLTTLVDDIIQKDIISFHNIKTPNIIKDFFILLMERSGKQLSINKVANILNISPDTAKRYLALFAETYLIYLVPRYGKTNETILSPKKVYASDIGIRAAFTGFRDKGSLFENYIYLKIKHKKPSYIYKDGLEIDFFTEDKILIESKYNKKIQSKQSTLFDSIEAKKKILISSPLDIISIPF